MKRCIDRSCIVAVCALFLAPPSMPAADGQPLAVTEKAPAAELDELLRLDPQKGPELQRMHDVAARALSTSPPSLEKHELRGIKAISLLSSQAVDARDESERGAHVAAILEVQAALRNLRKPPVPLKLGIFTTWRLFLEHTHRRVGGGTEIAANLSTTPQVADDVRSLTTALPDNGKLDQLPSTFWSRPPAISTENLYAGFGRNELPRLDQALCRYHAPKTSSGTNPGFDVECEGRVWKIKFGEINSEPFTARIFYALGYHVDPTDFTPSVKLRYDRRIFLEFHMRKPLTLRIVPLGIPFGSVQLQKRYDPFRFVSSATLKDGRIVPGPEFRKMLYRNPDRPHPEDSPENFREDVERQVDFLTMAAANVQERERQDKSIGPWDFGELGHEQLREVRGIGLLAAWLAWFDTRPENTKLRVRKSDSARLEHWITDLGGGMGAATGWFSPRGENPDEFGWTFTRAPVLRGHGRMTTPFRIVDFKPLVPTRAFSEMTIDDARWMARLIGQLSENQLAQALIASGYDAAETKLYVEKLVSRRDQMIRDLDLAGEILLLRPRVVNRPGQKIPDP